MAAAYPMMHETVWFDQAKYEKAEAHYQEHLTETKYGVNNSPAAAPAAPAATTSHSQEASSNLVNEIARARQHIQSSLNTTTGGSGVDHTKRLEKLEKENDDLRKMINGLCERIKKLELQVGSSNTPAKPAENTPAKPAEQAKPDPPKEEEDDDSDGDLFGSDSEDDEETERLAEERREMAAKAAAARKTKAAVVGKSTILLAVKGWDDETDFKQLEGLIRGIEREGLRWGAQTKLEPVAYGIQKLVINAIVVDDLVGTDFLEEEILKFEDLVQSVDILAFNKI